MDFTVVLSLDRIYSGRVFSKSVNRVIIRKWIKEGTLSSCHLQEASWIGAHERASDLYLEALIFYLIPIYFCVSGKIYLINRQMFENKEVVNEPEKNMRLF